jgi:hypothetical protein
MQGFAVEELAWVFRAFAVFLDGEKTEAPHGEGGTPQRREGRRGIKSRADSRLD